MEISFTLHSIDFNGESEHLGIGSETEKVNSKTAEASSTGQTDESVNETSKCEELPAPKLVTSECAQCKEWRKKYEEMRKSHVKLTVRHTELLMKHDDLVETAKGMQRPITEEECGEVAERFSNDIFTKTEIRCLQSVPLDKNKDSTFVLHCVEYAYKDDPTVLCKKTLKGTKPRYEIEDGVAVAVKPGKDPISPEKVKRIQELFIDRVTKSQCLASEFGDRVKLVNINKLIANAIKNVSNKAPKDGPSNVNADLNL